MNAMRGNTRRSAHPARPLALIGAMGLVPIVAILAVFPVVGCRRKPSALDNNMTRSLLATIEGGIRTYYAEVQAYPPSHQALVQALTGREDDDGKQGFGWRREVDGTFRGRVYGPYGGTDQLRFVSVDHVCSFVDAYDSPIMYYPFSVKDGKYVKAVTTNGGPADIDAYARKPDGTYFRTDFLLVSRGRDGKWEAPAVGGKWTKTDDITNLE